MREKARVEKAAQIEEKRLKKEEAKVAKQAEKQLRNNIQLSQLGKKQSAKPYSKPIAKVSSSIDIEAPAGLSKPPAAYSRSGRQIRHPQIFE